MKFLFFVLFSLGATAGTLPELYKDLHQAPELSFHEKETAARMAKELTAAGFQVTTGIGGHGVVGVLKNGSGPTVLFRTDLDALPVLEKTGLKYASQKEGVMHACGHDIHMTTWVGLARFLSENKAKWSGTAVFLGQPAEEKGEGARKMILDGLFKKFPKADYALAYHVDPGIPTGSIGYRAGYVMAAADSVDITFYGKGSHGAMPHMGINPVVLGSKMVLELQSIASQETAAIEPLVVTVGSFHAGTKHNIVSDQGQLQITVRTFDPKTREHVMNLIRRKAKAIAQAAGAPDPKVDIDEMPVPSLYNEPKLTEKVVGILKKKMGDDKLIESQPLTVAEDFSRYWTEGNIPSVMLFLGSIKKDRLEKLRKHGGMSLHSPLYFPDFEEAIATGVSSMGEVLITLLQKKS